MFVGDAIVLALEAASISTCGEGNFLRRVHATIPSATARSRIRPINLVFVTGSIRFRERG
jgi:hypothetical protein